jgi:hypothetical protein
MNARLERLTTRPARIHVLGSILTIVTLAALLGGSLLLADPTGARLGMTAAELGAAPFTDYTIPGAVLLGLFGLVPVPILIGLWLGKGWARELSGVIGAGLVVWTSMQVIWFGLVSPMQVIVWFGGILLLAFAGAPVWKRTMA